MTTLTSDNFDSDTPGSNAPGWTALSGTWSVGTTSPVSGSQSLSCATMVGSQVNLYTAGGYAQADQACSVDFVYAGPTVRTRPAPMIRVTSTSLGAGYVLIFSGNASENNVTLYKVVNGTYTSLGFAAHNMGTLVAGTTKITMEIRAIGTTIEGRAYVSGGTRPTTPAISITDSTSSAGAPGIYAAYTAGDTPGGFDNFVWTNGAVVTAATGLTLSAPTTGVVGTANTVTVGANGTLSGSVTVNLTATDGTFNPTSVTISAGTPTATSAYTPASAGAKTLTATDAAAALTAATAPQTESVAAPTFDQTAVLFSPGNWSVGTSSAKTINDGAYFKTIFAGTSLVLSFDISATSSPLPKLVYRVDGVGSWQTVDLAATVTVTMPSETSALTTHSIDVYVAQTSEANSRWSPQNTAVILTGMTLSTGGLTLPTARPLKGLWFGDSIMDGVNTIGSSGDSTVRGRQQLAYPFLVSELLGVEFGVVAFGGTGWVTTGGGSVPVFPTTYSLLWGSGPARSFTGLDFIVINHGQNDASNSTTTQVTVVLNALIAATDRRTKIIVLEPLSGRQNANLIAGIAATTAPSRITYVNTFTGVSSAWFNTANSADGVHPYGFEHRNSIAPKCAAALRPIIQPIKGAAVAQQARTITLTLVDAVGTPRANLSGIKWSIFDQVTPDAQAVAVDQGTGATTDGSGVLTLSVFSTKSAGTNVWLTLSTSDGTTAQSPAPNAFSGPAVLA